VPPDRLVINPDCGLRHLPPDIAREKLAAMVAGAALVRAELGVPDPAGTTAPAANGTAANATGDATTRPAIPSKGLTT
jgi:5-methyltetrahydropteroyltriglutamate--homocysteine methyltransferase